MTYDAADQYVVMFGGAGARLYNETWVFQNNSWRELFPAVAPPALGGGGMVYDAQDGYVLLFGGQVWGVDVGNQTWKFHAGNWTELFPTVSPPPRQLAAMTYDAADGYVLLYGGNDNELVTYGDTWSYSGGVWTNRTSPNATTPGARTTSMAYDPADGYVVLFGGSLGSDGWMNDTWKYLHGTWTELYPAVSPTPRWTAPIAYDAHDGYVVVYGSIGVQSLSGYDNDTWEFRAGTWVQANSSLAPVGRWVSAMTYDPLLSSIFLFGGYRQPNDLGDTWTFQAGAWSPWISANFSYPMARAGSSMAFDAHDKYVLLFGGQSPAGPLNDTWSYSAGSWTHLTPGISPSARGFAAMTYDSTDHYILLFGGYGPTGALNDTWRFSNGTWSPVSPTKGVSPPARWAAALADDPHDGYALLFGGATPVAQWDTWSYSNGTWRALSPAVPPAARSGAAIAYDPLLAAVVLFGGVDPGSSPLNATEYGDTWTFSAGNWTLLSPGNTPGPRDGAGLAYLPSARGLVLYGGIGNSTTVSSFETWLFDGANWSLLVPSLNPGPAQYFGFAWESVSGRLTFFGPASAGAVADTWQFSYGNSTNGSGYPAGPLRVATSVRPLPAGVSGEVWLLAQVSGGRLPYTLQWIFGDGSQGSALPDVAVAHTYTATGRYTATLTVQDGSGEINRTSTIIQIGSAPSTGGPLGLPFSGPPAAAILLLAPVAAVLAALANARQRARTREQERRDGDMLVQELRDPEAVIESPGP